MSQSIQGLVEAADNLRAIRVDEPNRLLTQDILFEVAVEECVGDIKLSCRTLLGRNNGEHCLYGRRLDHLRECFLEIHPSTLCEFAHHPSSLVALE